MLNIDFKPTFTRTATFFIPAGTGHAEQSCEATFEALDIPALEEFDLAKPEHVETFLTRVVVGLGDVVDKDGNEVPFTPDILARLLRTDWGRQGLVRAYVAGRRQAAEGN